MSKEIICDDEVCYVSQNTSALSMKSFSEFVYYRTYSKWNSDLKRREKWEETVERVVLEIKKRLEKYNIHENNTIDKIREYIQNQYVMPSMRFMSTAGKASEFDNIAIYNCSFMGIDCLRRFSEMLYILMNGCGVGFSVQKKYINKLPMIKSGNPINLNFSIEDTKRGWAESIDFCISTLFENSNTKITFDYSKIRPAGARLKTMGGFASGPEPLQKLHEYLSDIIPKSRSLKPIQILDICNMIATVVVSGGVRRSAQICLFDPDEEDVLKAKSSWPFPIHRTMSNNSICFEEKPSPEVFNKFWKILSTSGSGEPGIFNLQSAKKLCPIRRNSDKIAGINPCAEILLRCCGLCNLSEVIVRENDSIETLLNKIEVATIIGIIQSTFTDFQFLSKEWVENANEERLLGVSLSGIMDNHGMLFDSATLDKLKNKTYETTTEWCKKLNINFPSAITAIKPSGTVSQIVDCSSGIHSRYSQYYIRRYRIASKDPLCKLLFHCNIELIPENGQDLESYNKAKEQYIKTNVTDARNICFLFNPNEEWSKEKVATWIVEFAVESPNNCMTRHDLSAIEQFKINIKFSNLYTEHNTSQTIYVRNNEWELLGEYVYMNWDKFKCVSFLPFDDTIYRMAPYEEITKEKYETFDQPKIKYEFLKYFENVDLTEEQIMFACTSGKCEI